VKRPTWATVAGVLGIIAAGAGVMGSAQMVMTAAPLRQQNLAAKALDKAVGSFTKPGPRRDEDSALLEDYLHSFRAAIGTLTAPAWYPTWCVAGGVAGLAVAGALLVAASALLQVRRWAIVLFYCTAGLDIAWAIAKLAVASGISYPLSMTASGWALPAIVVDAALVVVVAMGDKAAFRPPAEPVTSSAQAASTPQARP
jgi:hypothetical protein